MSQSDLMLKPGRAVKAIIYRGDGRLLLQQRDDIDVLPYQGCWGLFGGGVDDGEEPRQAMVRELTEELGRVPGGIGSELFVWKWSATWVETINHFYPVLFDVEMDWLELREGKDMQWYYPEEILSLSMTPDLYENYSEIVTFLSRFRKGTIELVEKDLLACYGMRKKNARVFYAMSNPFSISKQLMVLLREYARLKELPIFRCCLHTDDSNDVHEMLMIHPQQCDVGPLKQDKTSLSYHMIDGELEIKLYDNSGLQVSSQTISSQDGSVSRSVRLNANQYRSIHTKTPHAIFLEVASGPFMDSDTVWFNA